MLFTGFLAALLLSSCWAADESSSEAESPFVIASHDNSNDDAPFVVASHDNSGGVKVSNLLPDLGEIDAPPPLTTLQSTENRGRSDIEIQDDQPSRGYFYPKPSKPFYLPEFTTLDASAPLNPAANSAEENAQVERLPRSPQYRPPYFGYRRPPLFIPGFIPQHNIRPLPALYGGRPGGF